VGIGLQIDLLLKTSGTSIAMKRLATIPVLAVLVTRIALAGDFPQDVIGVIKSDAGTVELLSDSCARPGALIAARAGSILAERSEWLSQQPGRVLFMAATKDSPMLLVCYEKTASGIRAYGPSIAESIEYPDNGIQWLRKPAHMDRSAQASEETPPGGASALPPAIPSIREASSFTDENYRYGIVEATCSDMARFLASSTEPGDSDRAIFVNWLALQPGKFVYVDRLSDGTDTGERGCYVRTGTGLRITVHRRAKLVEYEAAR
jgi:hypothetical protein